MPEEHGLMCWDCVDDVYKAMKKEHHHSDIKATAKSNQGWSFGLFDPKWIEGIQIVKEQKGYCLQCGQKHP